MRTKPVYTWPAYSEPRPNVVKPSSR